MRTYEIFEAYLLKKLLNGNKGKLDKFFKIFEKS